MASSNWTFFSNHGHVIISLGLNPKLTHREIAEKVGITERAVQKIISDLVESDFVSIKKEGRNNEYIINNTKHLKHKIESCCEIRDIIELVSQKRES